MSNLQQAISRLTRSSHYQELATYKPPFDPFEVMGITYRERSHSSVLAWLLGDAANKEFREKFVLWIVSQLDNYNLSVGTDELVGTILEYGDEVEEGSLELETYRERFVLRDLKIRVPAWCDAGLPFTLLTRQPHNPSSASLTCLSRFSAIYCCARSLISLFNCSCFF